jgi:pteridine reductase
VTSGCKTPEKRNDLLDLLGKTALVTGAGRRVGAAIARALGARGMRVGIHHHASKEGAERTLADVQAAGGDGVLLQADLGSRAAARRLVDDAIAQLGGLDVLVPSAASFERVSLHDAGDDELDAAWDRTMALNLETPFAMAHRALPELRRRRGSIVMITCTSTILPFRNHLPYVVAKGALKQLVHVLALEAAPEVRVNAVAPGTVLPPEDMSRAEVEALGRRIPLGLTGSAEDVAQAVLYLASAPWVTGVEMVVDGGRVVAG